MYYVKYNQETVQLPKGKGSEVRRTLTYENLVTFDEHKSALSGVRLLEEKSTTAMKRLKVFSMSTDKNLILRHSKSLPSDTES